MRVRSLLQFAARICFVRRKLVFEAGLNDIHNVAPRIVVRFRFGDEGDLMRLCGNTYDYDKAAINLGRERLRAGDRLVLAERVNAQGNEIVFSGWLMSGQLDMGVRRYLPLCPDALYSYRLFTAPAHRGQKLSAAYFAFVRNQLEVAGQHRLITWVEARNHVSRRIHRGAGFRPIGCIWHIHFLFHSYFYAPRALRAHLRGLNLERAAAVAGAGASRA